MKTLKISDFLTIQEVDRAVELQRAKAICAEIIQPNIERINAAIGQENDPMYLAYMCEYVISKAMQEVKENA